MMDVRRPETSIIVNGTTYYWRSESPDGEHDIYASESGLHALVAIDDRARMSRPAAILTRPNPTIIVNGMTHYWEATDPNGEYDVYLSSGGVRVRIAVYDRARVGGGTYYDPDDTND
jgi:hypothetical protein